MTRRETPIEWKELLDSRQVYSLRALAEKLDVSPQTATRLVHGESTSRETIEAAAELLGVTADRIRDLRHEAPLPPFRLPPEADRLGHRQRTAIVAVVRAMLEPDHAPIEPTAVEVDEYMDAIHEGAEAMQNGGLFGEPAAPEPPAKRPRKGRR